MLIVCSGPDTFSARQKARELQQAFRNKFDPSGYSTEVLDPSLEAILNRLSAPSFFSTKRFLRVDRILDELKIAELRTLVARLAVDHDQTVLVTVEDGPPSEKILGECKKAPFFHYPYPLLSGNNFLAWCTKQAECLGATAKEAQEVARWCEGDSWLAVQELSKRAANPLAPITSAGGEDVSVFEAVDACVFDRQDWRCVANQADPDQLMITLTSQSRSLIRIHDGETAGVHPFLVKKFGRANIQLGLQRFLRAASSIVATRSGLCQSSEVDSLI